MSNAPPPAPRPSLWRRLAGWFGVNLESSYERLDGPDGTAIVVRQPFAAPVTLRLNGDAAGNVTVRTRYTDRTESVTLPAPLPEDDDGGFLPSEREIVAGQALILDAIPQAIGVATDTPDENGFAPVLFFGQPPDDGPVMSRVAGDVLIGSPLYPTPGGVLVTAEEYERRQRDAAAALPPEYLRDAAAAARETITRIGIDPDGPDAPTGGYGESSRFADDETAVWIDAEVDDDAEYTRDVFLAKRVGRPGGADVLAWEFHPDVDAVVIRRPNQTRREFLRDYRPEWVGQIRWVVSPDIEQDGTAEPFEKAIDDAIARQSREQVAGEADEAVVRSTYADWLDEQGDGWGARAQRFMAHYGKRPALRRSPYRLPSGEPAETYWEWACPIVRTGADFGPSPLKGDPESIAWLVVWGMALRQQPPEKQNRFKTRPAAERALADALKFLAEAVLLLPPSLLSRLS